MKAYYHVVILVCCVATMNICEGSRPQHSDEGVSSSSESQSSESNNEKPIKLNNGNEDPNKGNDKNIPNNVLHINDKFSPTQNSDQPKKDKVLVLMMHLVPKLICSVSENWLVFPHLGQCDKYYTCFERDAYPINCPLNHNFNVEKMKCELNYNSNSTEKLEIYKRVFRIYLKLLKHNRSITSEVPKKDLGPSHNKEDKENKKTVHNTISTSQTNDNPHPHSYNETAESTSLGTLHTTTPSQIKTTTDAITTEKKHFLEDHKIPRDDINASLTKTVFPDENCTDTSPQNSSTATNNNPISSDTSYHNDTKSGMEDELLEVVPHHQINGTIGNTEERNKTIHNTHHSNVVDIVTGVIPIANTTTQLPHSVDHSNTENHHGLGGEENMSSSNNNFQLDEDKKNTEQTHNQKTAAVVDTTYHTNANHIQHSVHNAHPEHTTAKNMDEQTPCEPEDTIAQTNTTSEVHSLNEAITSHNNTKHTGVFHDEYDIKSLNDSSNVGMYNDSHTTIPKHNLQPPTKLHTNITTASVGADDVELIEEETKKSKYFDKSSVCHDAQPGVLRPHEICNKFYVCDNTKAIENTCPETLHFNEDRLICDWPANVKCGERKIV